MIMRKLLFMAAAAIAVVMSAWMVSCADAKEGESKADWELRNSISGLGWHVDMLKDANGNWVRWENSLTLYFEVKFSASNQNFSSRKFYYNKDGDSDEATKEEYSSSNTAYTIKDAKIIEGTVNGEPYFRITLNKKPASSMECSLYFYRENKTYEVIMTR